MKIKFRLTGMVLTVASAALLTACTSTNSTGFADMGSGPDTFDSAVVGSADIQASPVDQTKRRPDTHPELRSGLWQFSQAENSGFPRVVETTVVEADEPGEASDTTALLRYNPEVINVAQAREGTEIVEAAAAGIETDADADVDVDVDADPDTGIRTNIDADTDVDTDLRNDSSSINNDPAGASVSAEIDSDTTTIRESSGAQTQDELNRLKGNERNRLDTNSNRNTQLEAAGSTTGAIDSSRCECCGQLLHTSK